MENYSKDYFIYENEDINYLEFRIVYNLLLLNQISKLRYEYRDNKTQGNIKLKELVEKSRKDF